jgi:xanthine dehydrogenase accessory factor
MDIFEEIVLAKKDGKAVVLATVVETQGSGPRGEGARMVVKKDGSTVGTVGGGAIEKLVIEEAKKIMNASRPKMISHDLKDIGMSCGGSMSIFLEPLNPAPQLLIFGAGHIGTVLAQIVKTMEFNVTVIDNRPDFANRDRLPWVDEVIAGEYLDAMEKIDFNESTYVVILTHKHAHDFEVIEKCMQKPHRYVGMIGSKKKVETVFNKLRKKGIGDDAIKSIHAPIGMDIAANTPAEIAIAISAQLVSVRNQGKKERLACPATA